MIAVFDLFRPRQWFLHAPVMVPVTLLSLLCFRYRHAFRLAHHFYLLYAILVYEFRLCLHMGRVHIFSCIVVQSILMPAVISVLLKLLSVMAVYRTLIQAFNNIGQIFIHSLFRFAHEDHPRLR